MESGRSALMQPDATMAQAYEYLNQHLLFPALSIRIVSEWIISQLSNNNQSPPTALIIDLLQRAHANHVDLSRSLIASILKHPEVLSSCLAKIPEPFLDPQLNMNLIEALTLLSSFLESRKVKEDWNALESLTHRILTMIGQSRKTLSEVLGSSQDAFTSSSQLNQCVLYLMKQESIDGNPVSLVVQALLYSSDKVDALVCATAEEGSSKVGAFTLLFLKYCAAHTEQLPVLFECLLLSRRQRTLNKLSSRELSKSRNEEFQIYIYLHHLCSDTKDEWVIKMRLALQLSKYNVLVFTETSVAAFTQIKEMFGSALKLYLHNPNIVDCLGVCHAWINCGAMVMSNTSHMQMVWDILFSQVHTPNAVLFAQSVAMQFTQSGQVAEWISQLISYCRSCDEQTLVLKNCVLSIVKNALKQLARPTLIKLRGNVIEAILNMDKEGQNSLALVAHLACFTSIQSCYPEPIEPLMQFINDGIYSGIKSQREESLRLAIMLHASIGFSNHDLLQWVSQHQEMIKKCLVEISVSAHLLLWLLHVDSDKNVWVSWILEMIVPDSTNISWNGTMKDLTLINLPLALLKCVVDRFSSIFRLLSKNTQNRLLHVLGNAQHEPSDNRKWTTHSICISLLSCPIFYSIVSPNDTLPVFIVTGISAIFPTSQNALVAILSQNDLYQVPRSVQSFIESNTNFLEPDQINQVINMLERWRVIISEESLSKQLRLVYASVCVALDFLCRDAAVAHLTREVVLRLTSIKFMAQSTHYFDLLFSSGINSATTLALLKRFIEHTFNTNNLRLKTHIFNSLSHAELSRPLFLEVVGFCLEEAALHNESLPIDIDFESLLRSAMESYPIQCLRIAKYCSQSDFYFEYLERIRLNLSLAQYEAIVKELKEPGLLKSSQLISKILIDSSLGLLQGIRMKWSPTHSYRILIGQLISTLSTTEMENWWMQCLSEFHYTNIYLLEMLVERWREKQSSFLKSNQAFNILEWLDKGIKSIFVDPEAVQTFDATIQLMNSLVLNMKILPMNKIHFNYIFELMGYILHQSNEVSLITPLSTLGCNLIHLAKLQTSFYPALASIGIQMMDILFKIHSSSNTSKKRKRESESTFTTTVQEAAFTRYLKIFSDQPKVKHHLTSLLVAYSQHTQSLDQLFLREAVFVVLAKCSQFEKERALCCGDKRVIKYLVDLFESHIKFRGKA